jgi:hypothetical protein
MIGISNTLSDFTTFSVVGQYDHLLSKEAIADPGQRMFGAQAGADRNTLTAIFSPTAEVKEAVEAIITQHGLTGYAVPGLTAILLKKGAMELEEVDLGATRLKSLVLSLGMPGDLLENGLEVLLHNNKNKPSSSKAHFHLLSALLEAYARLATEHNIYPEPAFLANFPRRSTSSEEEEAGGEGEGDDDEAENKAENQAGGLGAIQEEDQEDVVYKGTSAPPPGTTMAPPLFGAARPSGGATAVRPAAVAQVRSGF